MRQCKAGALLLKFWALQFSLPAGSTFYATSFLNSIRLLRFAGLFHQTAFQSYSDVNWTAEDIHRISWKDTSGAESFRIILNAEEGGPWDVAQDVNTSISNSTTPTYDWLFAPWIVLENDTILQVRVRAYILPCASPH
jgi:hypothetical protein